VPQYTYTVYLHFIFPVQQASQVSHVTVPTTAAS